MAVNTLLEKMYLTAFYTVASALWTKALMGNFTSVLSIFWSIGEKTGDIDHLLWEDFFFMLESPFFWAYEINWWVDSCCAALLRWPAAKIQDNKMFSGEGLYRAHLRTAEQREIFPSSSEAHISHCMKDRSIWWQNAKTFGADSVVDTELNFKIVVPSHYLAIPSPVLATWATFNRGKKEDIETSATLIIL